MTATPEIITRPELLPPGQSVALPGDDTIAGIRPSYATPKGTYPIPEGANGTKGESRKLDVAPVEAVRRPAPGVYSLPIQIWEGTVTELNWEEGTFDAMLEAKIGQIPRHAATISLEWVAAQDTSLVAPGAVFYLTLYKESERSVVRNAQEIRFRRLPSWSKAQIRRIREDRDTFLASIEA